MNLYIRFERFELLSDFDDLTSFELYNCFPRGYEYKQIDPENLWPPNHENFSGVYHAYLKSYWNSEEAIKTWNRCGNDFS